ncbi:MAG: hypothetical protein BYD32DRAFT_429273 [Podila humilis]|nr:MAG: hypothetical protein BYD32DRAFT_429273 [Podila humilis]
MHACNVYWCVARQHLIHALAFLFMPLCGISTHSLSSCARILQSEEGDQAPSRQIECQPKVPNLRLFVKKLPTVYQTLDITDDRKRSFLDWK